MSDTSLALTIFQKLNLEDDSDKFTEAYAYCLSYLTNGITAYQFQEVIKPYLPKGISAKVFRLFLMGCKYNYFTLKLFVLQLTTVRRGDRVSALALAKKTGVTLKDAKLIFTLWDCSPNFKRRIKTWAGGLPKNSDLSLKGLEKDFSTNIYPDVLKKIKGITYTKLRFICKASNLDHSDLHNELSLKALQAYYKIVPDARGTLFTINYVKQAVHNHAMNLIQSATTQKGGRLVNTGVDRNNNRVFSLLEVSENQMPGSLRTSTDGDSSDFALETQSWCATDPTESLENEITVSTLLDKYKFKAKKSRLLHILMGVTDDEFTLWLSSRKLCSPLEDNSDLQERISSTDFRKLISQFLHVNDDKVNIFLTQLQTQMTEKNKQTTKGKFNDKRSVSAATDRRQQPQRFVNSTRTYVEPQRRSAKTSRRRTDAN